MAHPVALPEEVLRSRDEAVAYLELLFKTRIQRPFHEIENMLVEFSYKILSSGPQSRGSPLVEPIQGKSNKVRDVSATED